MRPNIDKVPSFYKRYIEVIESENIVENLEQGKSDLLAIYENLSEEDADYAYQMDKWTLKQMLMHLIDTERVMAYRALRFARNDKTALAGFDQDDFVDSIDPSDYPLADLIKEYKAVRQATICLFKNMPVANLSKVGTASGYPMDVVTLAFIIPGHERHHLGVIRERYGSIF